MTTTKLKSTTKPDFVSKDPVIKTKTILKKSNTKRKTTKQHLKFAGPIKILIIEPKAEYCTTVWCAVGVGLVHICVGAINLSVLHYSVRSGDNHATVCCLAFHFFSAEAILSMNYANGWSTPMRMRHRKFAHVFLQLCGISCAITGTVIVIIAKGMSSSLHGLTGMIAAILAVISVISGVIVLFGKRPWLLTLHMSFGIPAFLLSSVSLISGLLCKPFKDWAGVSIVYILIALVAFYTIFIVTSSLLKCLSRV